MQRNPDIHHCVSVLSWANEFPSMTFAATKAFPGAMRLPKEKKNYFHFLRVDHDSNHLSPTSLFDQAITEHCQ